MIDSSTAALGLAWYVVFLLSTTCHEAAHALVAKLGGDLTAYHGGQVSLDPMPHIQREPVGMVIFPILSYALGGWMIGWASAPYDPYWAYNHPRRKAWVSLAGPVANFSLAILAAIGMHIAVASGMLQLSDRATFSSVVSAAGGGVAGGVATFLSLMFSLNMLLGTFNLLPIPPLDGYGVLGLFVSENQGRKLQEWQQSMAGWSYMGLMLAWQVFDPVFHPVYAFALRAVWMGHV
jgi:Zn-dependent protease